ncbi:MAG TPA: Ku protein [Acidimicrobiales bacterium]|nr:Ku protein [Acidimicrobiales bacterium]
MPRAIWSGSISFGLVSVPVKAYAAVRDHGVHFNQLEKRTGARIQYKKVSEKTGKELDSDAIESAYEVASGAYVVVDPDELQRLRPRTSRTIEVADFVNLSDVDPVYYERTYWLAPDGEAAERPYRLLLAAMEAEGKVGIGTVVMRNKQYLAAVRPLDGALAMSTMRFADEVVPQSDVDALSSAKRAKPDAKELELASQIIGSLATDWDPARYHDTYTEELRQLIEAKAKGKEIVVEPEAPADGNVLDLMAALEASLAAAKKGGGRTLAAEVAKAAEDLASADGGPAQDADPPAENDGAASKRPPAKKPPAKKPAAKKPRAGASAQKRSSPAKPAARSRRKSA